MCVVSSRRRKKNERKRLEGIDRESCLTRRRRSARAKLLTYRLRRHVWRPACDSITTLSDGIRHLGGIWVGLGGRGGGLGFEWSGDALRSRPIALSRIARRLFTCQRPGHPGGLGKGGGASSSLLRPPLFSRLFPHNAQTPPSSTSDACRLTITVCASLHLVGANVTDVICSRSQ